MTTKKTIALIVLISAIYLGIYFFKAQKQSEQVLTLPTPENTTKAEEAGPKPIESKNTAKTIAVLEINGTRYEKEITSLLTVYDFMAKLKNEGKITFTEKTYTGMGKFIDSINGVAGNGSKNWIYYVNGKEAEVGVSNYKIKPGDVVSWKYEKSY